MRKSTLINDNWLFCKADGEKISVNIPHCYNSIDGQDGSKMYRGTGIYERDIVIDKDDLEHRIYLEVGAASLSSKVFVNDKLCHKTKCGFSLFRVDISDYLAEGSNRLRIEVSNAVDNTIYPAMADFSFYGGLYRDVRIIVDDSIHFEEIGRGLDGLYLTPTVCDKDGMLDAEIFIKREKDYSDKVLCEISIEDTLQNTVVSKVSEETSEDSIILSAKVSDVHLWNGLEDPFLYSVNVKLYDKAGNLCDERTKEIGFRTVEYSKEAGLLLNGNPYKLHGVSKHQDFGNLGNAVTEKELQKDLELILETGANSVRCSHYQHCDRWYELCDRAGLLVWAEIPVISSVPQNRDADDNAFEQLELLINQVRNHTCVYCYGVQNEVCMISKNSYTFDLVDRLSRKAKESDNTRLTAQANEYGTENDSPILDYTDILGFNYYYGWYYGKLEDLQDRLDSVHEANPDKPLILTEYGVDTNVRFHSDSPKANDYSEEYQLKFLENAINAIEERKFMAGGYVWNMFDFGSAGRAEGGEKGKNQKGLVTIDRQTKKDAFYLYKAHWSGEKFVYVAGRRYINRPGDKTDITVISNLESLTLKVNGECVDTKKVTSAMTVFENVKLIPGSNEIQVYGGNCQDTVTINSVDKPDETYVCKSAKESDNAVNWFEGLNPDTMEKVEKKELRPEGFSFENSICDIFSNKEAKAVFIKYLSPIADGPRFDEGSPISVNALLGFVKAMNIPESLLIACEQEINTIDKIN